MNTKQLDERNYLLSGLVFILSSTLEKIQFAASSFDLHDEKHRSGGNAFKMKRLNIAIYASQSHRDNLLLAKATTILQRLWKLFAMCGAWGRKKGNKKRLENVFLNSNFFYRFPHYSHVFNFAM